MLSFPGKIISATENGKVVPLYFSDHVMFLRAKYLSKADYILSAYRTKSMGLSHPPGDMDSFWSHLESSVYIQ